jgi:hypothetical protein
MLKLISVIVFIFTLTFHGYAAAYSQDTGTISQLYATPSGAIALKLKNGFINANATGQCLTSNGFAGLSPANASAYFKDALLAATSFNKQVMITISGCEGSSWFKISDIYIKN